MPHTFTYTCRGITTRISALGDGLIRVTRTRREAFLERVSPVVVCTERAEGTLQESPEEMTFSTALLTLHVNRQSGAIRFCNPQGQTLLREPDRRAHLLQEKPVYRYVYDAAGRVTQGQSVDGVRARAEAAEIVEDRKAYECRQNFVFDVQEGLYGLGSHEEGYGNLRGRSQLLYQHNMKAVVPVIVSTKGYGLLFDMGCLMTFHDDEQGSYLWADCADELDWYFLYGGGSYPELMRQYRLLTGETPMLPRYALGYIQSKERYVDAQELLSVADEYRRREIPLDMVVLDWQSWPEGQWGYKCFDEKRFPDPAGLTAALHEKHVRMMISIWPSMQGERNGDRREMLEHGCMLGNRLNYNAFDPAARALYWKQANEGLFRHGVDAWWCDCTEPFEADWRGSIRPEPLVRARVNTDETKRYLDPTQISLYSLWHSRGIWEGQRSVTQQKRVCNLTRSSWAGQHRYATITWSGDVSANWETLRRHIPEGLNFCATGEGYWSTDIGGFFPNGNWEPWFYEGDFDRGVADPGYRELFVRWAQYAAFLPMMRAHGTGTPREIWHFGEAGEPFYEAIAGAIRLRCSLVPYLYSLMARNHDEGLPMLRVPALMYPQDAALRSCENLMLLGDALLICPVTRPMYYLPEGVEIPELNDVVEVRLPAGSTWYEMHTGVRHEGGQTVRVHAPLDVIPVFVRGGSILPLADPVQHTDEVPQVPLNLTVYPGADGEFTLYDDAGDGYGCEVGECARIRLTWDDTKGLLTVGAREGSYPGMPAQIRLRICLNGGAAQEYVYTGDVLQLHLC